MLTLGYLARDRHGHTYVVVAMAENPKAALASNSTEQLVGAAAGALDLLH